MRTSIRASVRFLAAFSSTDQLDSVGESQVPGSEGGTAGDGAPAI